MIDEKILAAAKEAVIDGDRDTAVEIANQSVADGLDPDEMINDGFVPGIMEIGDMFEDGEVFLPEVMMSADAIQGAVAILNAEIEKNGGAGGEKNKVVLATVEADLHDIGKGIVASIMVANGFEVIDLGKDVPAAKIVETAETEGAKVIGTSAMLTTTMTQQQVIENLLQEKGLKGTIKTIVGGAPVTTRWASKIGADGFGESAGETVTYSKQFTGQN